MKKVPLRGLLLAALVLFAGCDKDSQIITDNYGPPAGYATIAGEVEDAKGNAISDIPVFLHYCLRNKATNDTLRFSIKKMRTNDEGFYKISESLPPVGAFEPYEGELLTLKCEMIVGSSKDNAKGQKQGAVTFYKQKDQQKSSIIDLIKTE